MNLILSCNTMDLLSYSVNLGRLEILSDVRCRLWLWAFVIALMGLGQAVRALVDFWLSFWVNGQYNLSTHLYLGMYAALVSVMLLLALGRGLVFTEAMMLAARSMHRLMAESVLRAPQLFFDQVRCALRF
jgi:hypothetical protein